MRQFGAACFSTNGTASQTVTNRLVAGCLLQHGDEVAVVAARVNAAHHLVGDEMKPDIRGVSQARFAAGRANRAGDYGADAMRNHGHGRRQYDAATISAMVASAGSFLSEFVVMETAYGRFEASAKSR
ncbi:MAG: hypothetical protein FD119_2596 [Stygiobacter sp.]|nr:MAG: hypothetical protein FD119_2596 [Stygiobacter sp.]